MVHFELLLRLFQRRALQLGPAHDEIDRFSSRPCCERTSQSRMHDLLNQVLDRSEPRDDERRILRPNAE